MPIPTRMALAESRAQVVLNPIGWMTKSGQIKQTNWLLPQEQIEDQQSTIKKANLSNTGIYDLGWDKNHPRRAQLLREEAEAGATRAICIESFD